MRPAVEKKSLGQILKWAQRTLFACGILLLGFCGFALADAWIFQQRASLDLDRQLRDRRVANVGAPAPAPESLIGRLEIPRLLLSVVVVEGIGRSTLRRAVGHIPGTALPGGAGNVGLAGHRDTFFRSLKDLRIHDEIQFSTLKGDFKYEVESLGVVDPDNAGALAPSDGNVLTMVTCYPFYYVGPAPKRWIVKARQVSPQTAPPSTVE